MRRNNRGAELEPEQRRLESRSIFLLHVLENSVFFTEMYF